MKHRVNNKANIFKSAHTAYFRNVIPKGFTFKLVDIDNRQIYCGWCGDRGPYFNTKEELKDFVTFKGFTGKIILQ